MSVDASNMSDRRLLATVHKMNEEASKNNVYESRSGSFNYFSTAQQREFEASIIDIMGMISRVKNSNRSLTMTRRNEKKEKKEMDGRSFRLMMSKPTKHLNKVRIDGDV